MRTIIAIAFLVSFTNVFAADFKDCAANILRLKEIEKSQNHCKKDEDCIVLQWPAASYSCNRLAHRDSNLTEFKEIMSQHKINCVLPLYECKALPTSLACIKGACAIKPWFVENIQNATEMTRNCLSHTDSPVKSDEMISGTVKTTSDGEKYWHMTIDLKQPAPDTARFIRIYYSGSVEYIAFHKNKKFQIDIDGKCK